VELALPESDKTHDLDHECRKILEQSIKKNKDQIDRLLSLTELIEDSVKSR
jgi:hypothetical protein